MKFSMCTRLIVAIPDSFVDAFRSGPIQNLGWLSRLDFTVIADALPPNYVEIHFLATYDVLHITNRRETTEQIHRDRWRNLGWSEARMRRTLVDMRAAQSQKFIGLHDELRRHIAAAAEKVDPLYLFAFPLPPPATVNERVRVTPQQLIGDSSLVQYNRLIEVSASK